MLRVESRWDFYDVLTKAIVAILLEKTPVNMHNTSRVGSASVVCLLIKPETKEFIDVEQ